MAHLNPNIVTEIPVHDPTNFHPVLLIWSSRTCRPCDRLYERWNELKARLLALNPDLRIVININEDMNLRLAPPIPACLNFLNEWVPNIIYIPGDLWNLAVADPNYILRDGVQVMNGVIEADRVLLVQSQYATNNVDHIIAWVDDINPPDLKEPQE